MNWLAVAIGGAIGSMLRYLLSLTLNQTSWPYGTWFTNLLGSFLIGFIFVWGREKGLLPPVVYTLLVTGMMGGFTTFSSFSLEVVQYLQTGEWERAFLYVLASVGLGLCAVYLGLVVGRQFLS
ncbi:fluoride efflux transporter CrcB [Brevibacillus ginsengisoli]|uniref:fluoride efflux transporter CrcB n=1 Tax=Brevibacillus ginsengisoli TaxID=363854 RepID=UPI003CEB7F3E